MNNSSLMEKIVSLCKRRGFIFPGSEIYSGLGGFWDFGPLGVLFKNNLKNLWWKTMVQDRGDIVGLDSTIIHASKVWETSGHVISFTDPLRECKKCHLRFRADKLISKKLEAGSKKIEIRCPECDGELTEVKQFNLMFKTFVGPVEDGGHKTYLRPETCQGIFINFNNVLSSMHLKLPFGIAQIGKGFRNEITTGDFIFRDREFEMMELEFFVKPGEDERWHDYWLKERINWHQSLGLKKENLRFYDHPKKSLAHYSKRTVDIEYNFPFGWSELEGIANRTDFDLKNHSQISGRDLSYFDEVEKKKYYPYVVEPSVGVERLVLALLVESYTEEKDKNEIRVLLKLNPKLAPIKVAVFPLLANKEDLIKKARKVYNQLRSKFIMAWDDIGNIGKRYRRQDEIGTPWCITVDFQTLKDETVTIRDRDTMKQERIKISEIEKYLDKYLLK